MKYNHLPWLSKMNRGHGAGGAATNLHGKKFEELTNQYTALLSNGYILKRNPKEYLIKTMEDRTMVYLSQHAFKSYMKHTYGINFWRCPDEAYLTEYTHGRKVLHIVEKKEQRVEGSVETKLWAGPGLLEEFQMEFESFDVHYAFCLNSFLKQKMMSPERKYQTLTKILDKHNIRVFYGEDADYASKLMEWVHS
jgi:hypothetical protein